MSASKIQWTDSTWNPVRGCALVSPGCTNCYAMRQAHRFSGPRQPYFRLTKQTAHGPVWTGRANTAPEMLAAPLHWRKPRRVFVNSMSDLFHDDIPDDFIAAVFGIMAMAPQHTFQILTKRPKRMREWFDWIANDADGPMWGCILHAREIAGLANTIQHEPLSHAPRWPLPNVWIGASMENQDAADDRIQPLSASPAAVRFISAEPLIGPIDFSAVFRYAVTFGFPGIDWVIVGGESGPGARPCDLDWVRDIRDQCVEFAVPVFVKQLGASPMDLPGGKRAPWEKRGTKWRMLLRDRAGGEMSEWPKDLRVRQFPAAGA